VSRPLDLVLSLVVSRRAAFCRRVSSSSSQTGRTNSRLGHPARRMLQPRTSNVPASRGVPVSRTVWKDPGGTTVDRGSAAKGIPEVLIKGERIRIQITSIRRETSNLPQLDVLNLEIEKERVLKRNENFCRFVLNERWFHFRRLSVILPWVPNERISRSSSGRSSVCRSVLQRMFESSSVRRETVER